jgi:hypothetical protein
VFMFVLKPQWHADESYQLVPDHRTGEGFGSPR